MIPKYRSFCKLDFNTSSGPLRFSQKEIDGSLWFVCDGTKDEIKYPFEVPFLDSDWILHQFTGVYDKKGVEIYDMDIVKSTAKINGAPKDTIFLVRWNRFLCNYALDLRGEQYKWLSKEPWKEAGSSVSPIYQDAQTDFAKLTGSKSKTLEIIGNMCNTPQLIK